MTNDHPRWRRPRYLEVIYDMLPSTDEQARTDDGMRAEVESWLTSLGLDVHMVSIRPADERLNDREEV